MLIQHLDQNGIVVEVADLASSNKKSAIHVLHVDDDLSIQEITKLMLQDLESNIEIDCACCVDEAFKKLTVGHFDVVVSDFEMPQKDGLQFLKELREEKNDVPFILFTGKGREDIVVKALNLGADSYINKNGSPETVYCELADAINKTVERKKSRELLAKSESKYRALVENSLQGIAILQAVPLRLVFANGAMGKILGYSSEELMALSPEGIMSLVHHEDRVVFFRRMENRLRGEPPGTCYEFRGVRKDGSIIWLSALANRVEYEGQPAVQGLFLDVNESKKTEEILRESEARYRELANCLPDIVFETDLDGQLIFANERASEISGYSHGELEEGLNIMQFLVPEDREKATKNIQRLLAGGSYAPAEYTFVRKNGTTFPALITATPCICKNKVTGLRGLVLDITERKKTDLALLESEGRLRTIFEGASDGILVIDPKTKRFVFANPRICEITGYSLEELLKLNVSDIHLEKDLPYVNDQLTKQLQGKITLAPDIPVLRKDSKVVYCDINSRPAKIGEQEYLVGFFREITERKKAEEVLQESEESFSCLIDSLDDLVFVLDFDGIFKNYHQPSHKKELYAPPEDFIGKHFQDVLPRHVAELCQAAMKSAEDSGKTQEFDYILEMNGVKSWYNARLSPSKNASGRISSVTVIVRNITERKETEESLEKEQQELNRIIDSSPIIIFYKDKEGKFIRVNEAFAQRQNLPKEKFLGKTVFDFYSAEIAQGMANDDLEVLKSGYPRLGIIEQYESASGMRWVQTDKVPTFDKNGISTGLVGFAQDITERKKAEEELKMAANIFDLATDSIFVTDTEGNIVNFNEAAYKFRGYTKDEMAKMNIRNLDVAESAAQIEYRVKVLLEKGSAVFESVHLCKDKTVLPVEINARIIDSGDKKLIVAVARDVSERTKAQKALLISEEKYRETIQNANVGIVAYQPDGKITLLNPRMQKMTGYTIEEIPSLSQWFGKLYPNEMERQKIKDKWFKKLTDVGEVKEGQATIITKQGEQRIFLFDGFRLLSGDFIAFARDITDRVKAEEALNVVMNQLVLVNEKLGVVGSLTRHDVGNKLMAAKSNLYLLKKRIGDNPDLAKYLDGIDCALASSSEIFEFSRLYERIGVEKASKENVFECFNQAALLMPNRGNVKIMNECHGLVVVADSLLRQLFYNFIDNSLKHGQKVTQIRLYYTENDDGVKLFYEDNGIGVSEANKPKLFESGFTTGKGSGLGLYLIKKMMDVYGWTITETGEPGKGAKFTITIPKLNKNGKENYQIT